MYQKRKESQNKKAENSENSLSQVVVSWFPGHMAKTRRKITESLSLVDAVVEILDARIPLSSQNPELKDIISGKPRLILLNKCDMADFKITSEWIKYFEKTGITALAVDSKSGRGIEKVVPAIRTVLKEKTEQNIAKGMVGKPLRVMVAGIPNVGKSSFINKLARGNRARVEDRPGVTRGNQWFTIEKGLEILDTPGVLWPKFEDETVGLNLAFTGAIKDTVLDIETLAVEFLKSTARLYKPLFDARYKIDLDVSATPYEMLCQIGKKRGMVVKGGEIDTERAAIMLLDEYRGGILGKITFEHPERKV